MRNINIIDINKILFYIYLKAKIIYLINISLFIRLDYNKEIYFYIKII